MRRLYTYNMPTWFLFQSRMDWIVRLLSIWGRYFLDRNFWLWINLFIWSLVILTSNIWLVSIWTLHIWGYFFLVLVSISQFKLFLFSFDFLSVLVFLPVVSYLNLRVNYLLLFDIFEIALHLIHFNGE
jgi:hypothetical protein